MKKTYVLVRGRIKVLKPNVDFETFQAKYPDAKRVNKPPTMATMERWINDCMAKATDGCWVEPDGICAHGHESYIRVLGYI